MAEAELQHIHQDLEILKRDVAELKTALLGTEGQLSDWAKIRIESYLRNPQRRFVSQADMEKEFS